MTRRVRCLHTAVVSATAVLFIAFPGPHAQAEPDLTPRALEVAWAVQADEEAFQAASAVGGEALGEDETHAQFVWLDATLPPVPLRKPRAVDVIERVFEEAHGLELMVDEELRHSLLTLAKNVYFEARGENLIGQTAVAFVTLNRVESRKWPDSIDEVVYQPYQFSWTKAAPVVTDFEAFELAARIALLTLAGCLDDPTGGADHYYAPERAATPAWARRFTKVARIDGHVFFTASAN